MINIFIFFCSFEMATDSEAQIFCTCSHSGGSPFAGGRRTFINRRILFMLHRRPVSSAHNASSFSSAALQQQFSLRRSHPPMPLYNIPFVRSFVLSAAASFCVTDETTEKGGTRHQPTTSTSLFARTFVCENVFFCSGVRLC